MEGLTAEELEVATRALERYIDVENPSRLLQISAYQQSKLQGWARSSIAGLWVEAARKVRIAEHAYYKMGGGNPDYLPAVYRPAR